MEFELSEKVRELRERVVAFMDEHVYPAEPEVAEFVATHSCWTVPPVIEELKAQGAAPGYGTSFCPTASTAPGLTNLEYAPLCEIMGRSLIAPEVFNCSAPDTGNMEVLVRYGTRRAEGAVARAAARRRDPLGLRDDRAGGRLVGRDEHRSRRSCATATTTSSTAEVVDLRRGRSTLQGLHLHGQDRPERATARQQSMILVPTDTPGVEVVRTLRVFGYDDAPHGHAEVRFENVRVPDDEHAPRRGPRLRDRPGAARARAHPSLHAR